MDNQQDFVTRQYASLLASGMDDEAARSRLGEVLGEVALGLLAPKTDEQHSEPEDAAARLADAAIRLDGSAMDARVAFAQSVAEARLFALDWWRPVRTFLLYVVFLLALAVLVAVFFSVEVLTAFRQFDRSMAMHDGVAGWVLSDGAIRLFGPLILVALLLIALAMLWHGMARRMARLRPLAGLPRFAWLHGRGGAEYQALLCLEYAAALHAGRVADSAVMTPALQLAGWPSGKPFRTPGCALGERLEQAQRLGTFADELDWQRRMGWSSTQSHLELSRDRLILFSRVVFYLLIGYMVVMLYLPIFSIAGSLGVH